MLYLNFKWVLSSEELCPSYLENYLALFSYNSPHLFFLFFRSITFIILWWSTWADHVFISWVFHILCGLCVSLFIIQIFSKSPHFQPYFSLLSSYQASQSPWTSLWIYRSMGPVYCRLRFPVPTSAVPISFPAHINILKSHIC